MEENKNAMCPRKANDMFVDILFALGMRLTRTEEESEGEGAYYLWPKVRLLCEECPDEFFEQPIKSVGTLIHVLEDCIDRLCCPALVCLLMPGANLSGMKSVKRWTVLLDVSEARGNESWAEEELCEDEELYDEFCWCITHLDAVVRHRYELTLPGILEAQAVRERGITAAEYSDELD